MCRLLPVAPDDRRAELDRDRGVGQPQVERRRGARTAPHLPAQAAPVARARTGAGGVPPLLGQTPRSTCADINFDAGPAAGRDGCTRRRPGRKAARSPAVASPGPGKAILPDGCTDLDSAADQFLAGLAPEDLLAFDQALQKDIARKFRGLGHVCLKPLEKGPAFRNLLLSRARDFLDARLDHSDPAAVFFRSRTRQGGTGRVAHADDGGVRRVGRDPGPHVHGRSGTTR